MLAKKIILSVLVVSIVGLIFVSQTLSQPQQQRGQRGQRNGVQDTDRPDRQGRQFDPERMRQMMSQRMQELFGATNEEWKILGPRVIKVQDLSRQVGGGFRGGMFGAMGMGRRGGPGGDRFGDRPGAPDREQTEIEKVTEGLRTLLENTSATPEQIKQQLTTVRAAKEKAKQQLAVAQKELREVITLRQEAQCVMMGILD
ncbi:MAG: hypothetical protein JW837_11700 [Sedimentisphaerales bacterium]|nr:hypothetical protein [Sedimentisphaerales bacterium]